MSLNDDLLSDDPDSQVVEEGEDVRYTPYPDEDSAVVVAEPEIITIGRKRRRDALRDMRQATSDQQRDN